VSDHDHDHEHERGGHEIDKLPNTRLFNLLFGLSFLVLISSIGVIQLFNLQVRGIEEARAQQPSFRLQAYRDETSALLGSHGTVTVVDEGGVERVAHHMPVADARKAVLDDAAALGAAPRYRGWENSSVAKTISTLQDAHKAAMPPRVPAPQQGEAPDEAPDEPGEPDEEAPAEAPAEEAPAEEAPEEAPADAPAEKPAPKAPAEKPAPKAPAEKPAPKAPAEKPAPKAPAEKPAPKPGSDDVDGE
jgi:FtsZ-interacting cell division protein ZipA